MHKNTNPRFSVTGDNVVNVPLLEPLKRNISEGRIRPGSTKRRHQRIGEMEGILEADEISRGI